MYVAEVILEKAQALHAALMKERNAGGLGRKVRPEEIKKPADLLGKHGINTSLATKKDAATGEWTDVRVCADSRPVNAITIRDRRTMPRVDDCIAKLAGASYITSLDLRKGFNQVPLHAASQPLTQFWWKGELWYWTRMTYGYVNAAAKFQSVMDAELARAGLADCTTCYIDDVCVYSDTFAEHVDALERLFLAFTKSGLRAHPVKCHFAGDTVEFLGHRVGRHGVAPAHAKTAAITEMTAPTSASELRSQLGLISYYRDFIPNASAIMDPLRPLLKKDAVWKRDTWKGEHQAALDHLKALLCKPGIGLFHFDPNLPTHVYTDFSTKGIAAVLAQVDHQNRERLVACISRSLSESEKRYPSFYGELLAVTWALRHFHPSRRAGGAPYFSDPSNKIILLS